MTCTGINNALKYVAMYDETDWGVTPGSPTYYHVPFFGWDVMLDPDTRQAEPFIGTMQRKHSRNYRGYPHGQGHCALYGWQPSGSGGVSLAQKMLDWSFGDLDNICPRSKGAEWAESGGSDERRDTGLRVRSAVLRGSEDQGFVDLTMDIVGQDEVSSFSPQAVPNDRNKLVEFEYPDVSFTLDGSTILCKAFIHQARRTLEMHYLNSHRPSLIAQADRVDTLVLVPQKTDATWDAIQRLSTSTEVEGVITMKGLHNGTGSGGTSYTKLTRTFPRLSFMNKRDSQGRVILFETLNFMVLKPDTSDPCFTDAWSEE